LIGHSKKHSKKKVSVSSRMDPSQNRRLCARLDSPSCMSRTSQKMHRFGRQTIRHKHRSRSMWLPTAFLRVVRKALLNGYDQGSPSPLQNTFRTTRDRTRSGESLCRASRSSVRSSTMNLSSASSYARCSKSFSMTAYTGLTCARHSTRLTEARAKKAGTKTTSTCWTIFQTNSRSSRRVKKARTFGVHA
jgi:hypothetical protein